MSAPYYQDDQVTLYHGDCLEIDTWLKADVLVTDPPYPNAAGHFIEAIPAAKATVSRWERRAFVFWNEMEIPPVPVPHVATHIWHRPNVNGRPYEPAFEFAPDGRKRRSVVITHTFIHSGVGPGSAEYMGHPTQKPVSVLHRLIQMTDPGAVIADPFSGSGSTLLAARNLNRRAIGVELEERYCEIAARPPRPDVPGLREHRMTSLQARIDAMRDELVNHRADGYATTTDVLRLLELIDELKQRTERTLDRKVARK